MKKSYVIIICRNGQAEKIPLKNKKAKDKWLYDYFTTGEEKWWTWDKYCLLGNGQISFEKWVKLFLKRNECSIYQSFYIRQGKILLIKEL